MAEPPTFSTLAFQEGFNYQGPSGNFQFSFWEGFNYEPPRGYVMVLWEGFNYQEPPCICGGGPTVRAPSRVQANARAQAASRSWSWSPAPCFRPSLWEGFNE